MVGEMFLRTLEEGHVQNDAKILVNPASYKSSERYSYKFMANYIIYKNYIFPSNNKYRGYVPKILNSNT